MRRFLLLPALVLALAGPCFTADVHADSSTYAYSFQLGFATITNLLLTDNIALAPTDNEGHNPQNGDGLQHAISIKDGKPILLVWRKADNWTAATDGYFTWVNGPNGLQKRLNAERFSFEANPDKLPVSTGIPVAAGANGLTDGAYAALLTQYEQSHPVATPPDLPAINFPPIPGSQYTQRVFD